MLLTELTGIKAIKDKSPVEIVNWINDNIVQGRTNLQILGNGLHGVALTDGRTVFKFWHRDSAYEEFYKFVQDYGPCKYLPKFYTKVKRLPFEFSTTSRNGDTIKGFSYVKMEKLDPVSGELNLFDDASPFSEVTLEAIKVVEALKQFAHGTHTTKSALYYALMNKCYKDVEKVITMKGLGITLDDVYEEYVKGEHVHSDISGIVEVIQDLQSMASLSQKDMDLHEGNFAMRDGCLVILDPISDFLDSVICGEILKLHRLNGEESAAMEDEDYA